MANDIMIPELPPGGPDPIFQGHESDGEGLGGGMGYGVIHFKSKEFYIRYGGQKKVIATKGADGYLHPVPYVDVIILRKQPQISHTYYKGNYDPNNTGPPTCHSTDGIAPDDSSTEKQSTTCAGCELHERKEQPNGRKTSKCRDNLRLAVFPLSPAIAETIGVPINEPILMRIPAGSLGGFKLLMQALKGAAINSFVLRVNLKSGMDYPQYEYKILEWLRGDAAKYAKEMSEHPVAYRILGMTPEGRSLVRREEGQISASPSMQQIPARQPAPDPVAERLAVEREARIAAARQQQPPPTIDVVAEEVRAPENVVPMKKPPTVEDAPPSIQALVEAMRPKPPGT